MAIQTIPVTINPTKEFKEVVDFNGQLFDKIRELKGTPKAERIAALTALLPSLITAVDGADELDDEVKSKNLDDNLAYFTKELGERVIPSARGEEPTL